MISTATSRIEQHLVNSALFSEEQISDILSIYRELGGSLTEIIADNGYANEETYLEALSESLNIPFLRLDTEDIENEILHTLPAKSIFQYHVIPIEVEENTLRIVTNDPFKKGLVDALRLASGKKIQLGLCPMKDIAEAAKKFYGVGGEIIEQMMGSDRIDLDAINDLGARDIDDGDDEASIVKFVNQIVWEAHQRRATDIHVEPMEKDLRIRYRIDGVLHQTPVPAALKQFQSAIISRIKVMAHLDIAEKRLPQDGKISVRIKDEEIDIRVSTMPTTYGESVSLRLLSRGAALLGLANLGLGGEDEKLLEKIIHKPNGIILVTGPTGSGKSTSLNAYLNTINSIDKRLLTAEDPIEYEMPGINQVQMKPEIGLTFATALRSFLRQDPDVIMVGEIRDKETAEIAIQAALTGHLVFSTLHTNDSAGGITRLVDMGVEPFLVSSSVQAIIAQRLIRRLCPECRKEVQPDPEYLKEIGFPVEQLDEGHIYEPVGCESCGKSGYAGRTGIYEVLEITDKIRQLIVVREPTSVIKAVALREGMKTLRDDGWAKVLNGVTTIEEIIRVSEDDEDGFNAEGS